MNFCNYIIDEICKKLNTKNITNSVYIAAYYKLTQLSLNGHTNNNNPFCLSQSF